MPVWVPGQVGTNELVAVGLALVPEEEQMPGVVPAKLPEEVEDLGATDVLLGVKCQVGCDATTAGRHDKRTDARHLFVGTLADDEGGGLSTGRPGSTDQRRHHEPCLVEADQACLEAGEFFLARLHSWRTQARMRWSLRSLATVWGLCGVKPQERSSRPTWSGW